MREGVEGAGVGGGVGLQEVRGGGGVDIVGGLSGGLGGGECRRGGDGGHV